MAEPQATYAPANIGRAPTSFRAGASVGRGGTGRFGARQAVSAAVTHTANSTITRIWRQRNHRVEKELSGAIARAARWHVQGLMGNANGIHTYNIRSSDNSCSITGTFKSTDNNKYTILFSKTKSCLQGPDHGFDGSQVLTYHVPRFRLEGELSRVYVHLLWTSSLRHIMDSRYR